MPLQTVPPLERRQLDQKGQSGHDTAGVFDQLDVCRSRAAGRQKIIVDQNTLSWLDGIRMDLQSVRAVFQVVLAPADSPRQLARLCAP